MSSKYNKEEFEYSKKIEVKDLPDKLVKNEFKCWFTIYDKFIHMPIDVTERVILLGEAISNQKPEKSEPTLEEQYAEIEGNIMKHHVGLKIKELRKYYDNEIEEEDEEGSGGRGTKLKVKKNPDWFFGKG